MDAEWFRLELPAELGGQPAPSSLKWSVGRARARRQPAAPPLLRRARLRAPCSAATAPSATRKIAQHMIDREWGATMVLTEPDAGSDVGAGRTKATLQDDGSWHIEGVKRFITSAEHDMSENIIHLVLARPVGVDGVGGPGTKGLSLFVVPKHHFDLETGELTGERNGAFVTGVEHKMGIKASTTCELTFGESRAGQGLAARRGARRHRADVPGHRERADDGRHQGDGDPVDRLPQRARVRQDPGPGRRPDPLRRQDGAAGARSRHHPDVRRSLLTQKSYAEALRALVIYTATFQDALAVAQAEGRERRDRRGGQRPAAADRQGLLLRARVGRCSAPSRCRPSAAPGSCRTTRSSSTSATPRSTRSTKAPPPSRAWTCSSARSCKNKGAGARRRSPARSATSSTSEAGNGRLKVERGLLAKGLEDAQALVGLLIEAPRVEQPAGRGRRPGHNIYKVGLNTTRLLMALGDVVCSLPAAASGRRGPAPRWPARCPRRTSLLRGQGRGGAVLRPQRAPEGHRRARHRRGDRPAADGPRRGRLLS